MSDINRRDFLRRGSLGLAAGAAGVGSVGGLALRAGAEPTPEAGDLREYERLLNERGVPRITPGEFEPTERNPEGPFYARGAPFRAKVSPPLAEGEPLVITGRVWSYETRKPLPGAVLDIWHADHRGRYDNNDEPHARGPRAFHNRARLITDETGYYEYETVHPGRYKLGGGVRPSHIHYIIRAADHQALTTQLYFAGDPFNDRDPLVRPSLITDPERVETGGGTYQHGVFDIVL